MFERFKPLTSKGQWVRIPRLEHTYEVYDRSEKEVVTLEGMPWVEYTYHWYNTGSRGWTCSSGAHRDKPCYGCAERDAFYEKLREKQRKQRAATGMSDEEKKANSPAISASAQYALAVTGVDTYYEVPLTNKDGSPRKSKAGNVIKNYIPRSLAKKHELSLPSKMGHNMHWSFGRNHCDQLIQFDEQLYNSCATCASDMSCKAVVCTECSAVEALEEEISGDELLEVRDSLDGATCGECGAKDSLVTQMLCECGEPQPGSLYDFDLRFKAVSSGESTILKISDIRVPVQNDDIDKLLATPLDVKAIFAGTPISVQAQMLGERAKSIDPSGGKLASSYTKDEDGDEGGDDEDETTSDNVWGSGAAPTKGKKTASVGRKKVEEAEEDEGDEPDEDDVPEDDEDDESPPPRKVAAKKSKTPPWRR